MDRATEGGGRRASNEEDKKQTLSPNKQKLSCEMEMVGTGRGSGGAAMPPCEVDGTGQEI